MYIVKILFSILIFASTNYAFSIENKILFKINNEIITSIDLLTEIKYLTLLNDNIQTLNKQELYEIAKNSIIKDKIKKYEISKYIENIILNKEQLSFFIKNISETLNFSDVKNFENYLDSQNIMLNTIEEKISIQVIWNDLIKSKYSNKIKINEKQIRQQIIDNKDQPIKKFLLSEIRFNLNDNENLEEKFSKIQKTIQEKGFESAALTHSNSETAVAGGQLGWINENTLNNKIKKIIFNIKINEYSEPIRLPSNFLILKVLDIEEIINEIDVDNEVNRIIENKTKEQLDQFSNLHFNKIKKEVLINEF